MGNQRYSELKHLPISPATRDYLLGCSSPQEPAVTSLIRRTAEIGDPAVMLIPVEQAALITMLTRLLNARTAVDIGTFTGFSALAMARGLAPGGRVITCDITDEWTDIAREHWKLAGVADRIDFHLAPADDTLRELPDETSVDIAFLDADKDNYETYYHRIVPMLRPGALLLVDNILFNGYVLDPALAEEGIMQTSATALRYFNAMLAADRRMEAVALPIADGLTIARKK